jgi:hypothetical protein
MDSLMAHISANPFAYRLLCGYRIKEQLATSTSDKKNRGKKPLFFLSDLPD